VRLEKDQFLVFNYPFNCRRICFQAATFLAIKLKGTGHKIVKKLHLKW